MIYQFLLKVFFLNSELMILGNFHSLLCLFHVTLFCISNVFVFSNGKDNESHLLQMIQGTIWQIFWMPFSLQTYFLPPVTHFQHWTLDPCSNGYKCWCLLLLLSFVVCLLLCRVYWMPPAILFIARLQFMCVHKSLMTHRVPLRSLYYFIFLSCHFPLTS